MFLKNSVFLKLFFVCLLAKRSNTNVQKSSDIGLKIYRNKKDLLRERKRHTARKRAQDANPPPVGSLTWPPPPLAHWPDPLPAGPDPPPAGWTWPPQSAHWPPQLDLTPPPTSWTWSPPPRRLTHLTPPPSWTWPPPSAHWPEPPCWLTDLTPPPPGWTWPPPASWTWPPPVWTDKQSETITFPSYYVRGR